MKPASWALAKDVLVEARRLPVDEREAFVRGRITDPELRAAIQRIIDGAEAADYVETSLSDEHLHTQEGSLACDDLSDDAEDLAIGSRVGKYVVLRLIGRGGMSRVYLGSDPQLRRDVALKCLASSSDAPASQRARILYEARAAARVEHTNVAIIHDVLEDNGRAFIVMEFLAGESLASRLSRGRMSIDEVVSVGLQLTSALVAAHAQGVVHRDLKPGNVQFSRDGVAKVLDFGIANAVHGTATARPDASTITAGAVRTTSAAGLAHAGTPQYMSPEQLAGGAIDHRSDLYSLGLILFEMATGERMHPTDDRHAIAAAHRKGALRADAVDARVPGALADVIGTALELDVRRRYQSAAEFEASLRLIARAAPASTAPREDRIRIWLTRLAIGVPLAIVLILALGWIKTFGFNYAFGRTGPFARFGAEPWSDYFRWGLRGNIARLIIAGGIVVLTTIAAALIRILESFGPIGRAAQQLRSAARHLGETTGLRNPNTLAHAMAAFGVAMIAAIGWLHADLLQASTASFNSAPLATLLPMSEQASARNTYQNSLTLVLGLMCFSLYKVQQLRRRERTTDGTSGIAALISVSAFAILMTDLPYRTFLYRDFERADLAGRHCYITGEAGDELLVLCPGDAPPRSRIVKKDDATLKRLGTLENVFRGFPSQP